MLIINSLQSGHKFDSQHEDVINDGNLNRTVYVCPTMPARSVLHLVRFFAYREKGRIRLRERIFIMLRRILTIEF